MPIQFLYKQYSRQYPPKTSHQTTKGHFAEYMIEFTLTPSLIIHSSSLNLRLSMKTYLILEPKFWLALKDFDFKPFI